MIMKVFISPLLTFYIKTTLTLFIILIMDYSKNEPPNSFELNDDDWSYLTSKGLSPS
jgi:hypothetical protein